MAEQYPIPPANEMLEPPKKSNRTLIIVIVVILVLCCCCALGAGLLYQYGDQILRSLGIAY